MERTLAAILALDTVGYARLVEADEAGTLAHLRSVLDTVVEPLVARHGGRVVKGTGDGLLAEFDEAEPALACATGIQHAMARHEADVERHRRIAFRIGINVGEIYRENGDVFGNGVIIAARLEALADAGGILVSGAVRERVIDTRYGFENLGPHRVKNIRAWVDVYRVLERPEDGLVDGLVGRLRRRRVVPWAIACVAVAWLLLQLIDFAADRFVAPQELRQAAAVVILTGVLLTLVLGWRHAERGRQKVSRAELLLIVLLLALAGNSLWLLSERAAPRSEPGRTEVFGLTAPPPTRHGAPHPGLFRSGVCYSCRSMRPVHHKQASVPS